MNDLDAVDSKNNIYTAQRTSPKTSPFIAL